MVEFRAWFPGVEFTDKVSSRTGYGCGRHALSDRDSLNFEFFIVQFRGSLVHTLSLHMRTWISERYNVAQRHIF